jgi:hypothetical protein
VGTHPDPSHAVTAVSACVYTTAAVVLVCWASASSPAACAQVQKRHVLSAAGVRGSRASATSSTWRRASDQVITGARTLPYTPVPPPIAVPPMEGAPLTPRRGTSGAGHCVDVAVGPVRPRRRVYRSLLASSRAENCRERPRSGASRWRMCNGAAKMAVLPSQTLSRPPTAVPMAVDCSPAAHPAAGEVSEAGEAEDVEPEALVAVELPNLSPATVTTPGRFMSSAAAWVVPSIPGRCGPSPLLGTCAAWILRKRSSSTARTVPRWWFSTASWFTMENCGGSTP